MAIKQIHITIAGATGASAVIAPTKFNKLGSIHFTFDDGSPGNFIAQSIFDNKFYTDGCGNNIPYALGVAINAGTGIPGDIGYNPTYLQKPQIDTILSKRGDVENHGFYHGGENSIDDLNQLHAHILLRTGYKMGFTVVPGATTGFGHASSLANYVGITSTGEDVFDEFAPERVHKLWPILANPYKFLGAIRDFTDDWQLRYVLDILKNEIYLISTRQRDFEIIGTHTTFDTPERLAGFQEVVDYIETILPDKVLVCCMREILDYRRMQVMPVTQSFSSGMLTITVDVVDENDTLRFEDLCFNITTDGTITGVSVDGFTDASFNPATGLVNVFKERVDWGDPPDPGIELTKIKGRRFLII